MSTSKHLRETHTELGGGRGIFTEGAKVLEGNVAKQVQELVSVLESIHPDIQFIHRKTLTKFEISPEPEYKPHSKGSGVKPDGGILFAKINDKLYPILVCEAKKQGTNDVRLAEGKKKQGKGNAIERAFKNFEEFRIYFEKYDYFPYLIFAYGCDFEDGSSINDRMDAMTRYKPRNEQYIFHSKQLATIYVQDRPFTDEEIFDRIKDVSTQVINHLLNA
jgi:type II restriction enzyme